MPESIVEQIESQFSARISPTESVGSVDFQQILLTKVTRLGNRFSLIGCQGLGVGGSDNLGHVFFVMFPNLSFEIAFPPKYFLTFVTFKISIGFMDLFKMSFHAKVCWHWSHLKLQDLISIWFWIYWGKFSISKFWNFISNIQLNLLWRSVEINSDI